MMMMSERVLTSVFAGDAAPAEAAAGEAAPAEAAPVVVEEPPKAPTPPPPAGNTLSPLHLI